MALVIPPGYAQISILMTQTGDPEPYVITFGIEVAEPPLTADNLEAIMALWDTGPGTQQAPTINFAQINAVVGNDGDPTIINVPTPGRSASGSGVGATQNVAYLVHKNSALGGRRHKGRMFVPGVLEGTVDTVGVVADATLTNWQTQLNSFFTNLDNTGPDPENVENMVILHSTSELSATPPPTVVTSLSIDRLVATQRRRLRR